MSPPTRRRGQEPPAADLEWRGRSTGRDRPLRILQVGTVETGGGAAAVASGLMRGYRARGCQAWAAVGRTRSRDPNVFAVPNDEGVLSRVSGYSAVQRRLRWMASRFPGAGWGWISRSLRLATHPRALADHWMGREDFEFPGAYRLLDLTPARPDVVHCHNLHGGYFDLRALAWLSRQVPTILTLHDAWALGGHCAHSLDCERWMTGCGGCPDLTIEPAIRRDATAENWRRKRDIYAGSRLFIATPSRWLMQRVEQSMLAPAVCGARVIPHGVDTSVFRPADKRAVREALDIPAAAAVVLVTAGARAGTWRDLETLRAAIGAIAAHPPTRGVRFVAMGEAGASLDTTAAKVIAVDYQTDQATIARYHQAADLYVHAARADTFPTVILEALACGTPVVATAVGGIPEEIRSAEANAIAVNALDRLERATGILVPARDAQAMAGAVIALLTNKEARRRLGKNAAEDARERFDVNQQVETYLSWYGSIIGAC